ncbi:MAG TPA: UDP-glucuronic acid decarboxylase family protein [Nocardioidaceae bacterium]|nr:UDP-glucuronic acid decarboxylase family protein [Nocardioidaceae bacterium]
MPLSSHRSADAPRRVLVTGGAGFVGSWLCERLLDRGDSVVCADNFSTGRSSNVDCLLTRPGFAVVDCDVTEEIPVDADIDWVLHLASPASPPDYLARPIETLKAGSVGTMNALELARRARARFVLASTSEIYGDPLEHPQREDYWGNVNPIGPRSVYDEAKRFSEALTTAYRTTYGADTGIVRIFNTYGPRMRLDDGRAIPNFIRQALLEEPITVAGNGTQTRSICYVEDTAAGLIAYAASSESMPINLGNPVEMSILDLAELIRELVGSSSTIERVDLPVDDPKVRCPDISRARERLGWAPQVTPADGLKQTIGWFAASMPAQS